MSCKELNCELDFITLDFEDGASEECLVAGLYEIEGKKYLSVVVGANEDTDFENDELEGYIYQYVDATDDEFELAAECREHTGEEFPSQVDAHFA